MDLVFILVIIERDTMKFEHFKEMIMTCGLEKENMDYILGLWEDERKED